MVEENRDSVMVRAALSAGKKYVYEVTGAYCAII